MNKSKVSTAIIHDLRRMKKDNTYPVKLRVTYNRQQKYYDTGYSLNTEDFDKVMDKYPRGKFKTMKSELNKIENKAIEDINELSVFSFEAFNSLYMLESTDKSNIYRGYEKIINKLVKQGRIGTSESYKYSMVSLKAFNNKEKLEYRDVTVQFLEDYEVWMLENGKSYTTIGFYLRCLRSVYNEAISDGFVNKDLYPFGRRKYEIPSGRNVKKALDLSEIKKIIDYKCVEGSTEHRARDYWIFSYLCNGINIKDLALLKYENIDFDEFRIYLIRAKTEVTKKKERKEVVAVLMPQLISIIDRWGTKPRNQESYVFQILSDGMTPRQVYNKVKLITDRINTYVRRIAKKVGITKNVTTYYARHSFSNILKQSGVSIEFISESLGHSNLQTTESYLDSFEDKTKVEFANKLIPK